MERMTQHAMLSVLLGFLLAATGLAQVERWSVTYGPTQSITKTFALGFDQQGNVYLAGEMYGQKLAYDEFTVVSLTAGGQQRWLYQRSGTAGGDDAATSFALSQDMPAEVEIRPGWWPAARRSC